MRTFSKFAVVLSLATVLSVSMICSGFMLAARDVSAAALPHEAAHSFVFGGAIADAYIVLLERDTGDLVNGTTGDISPSVLWSEACIKANRHSQSNQFIAQIPRLMKGRRYILLVYDGYQSANKEQIPKRAYYYWPEKRNALPYEIEFLR